MALYYAGLLALAWAGYTGRLQILIQRASSTASISSLARRLSPILAVLLLSAASVLVWRLALSAPDKRLHLTVLDTNANGASGEALLIETPSGRFVLVGGGPSPSRLSEALGRRLPPFTRRLDWLVVAGTQDGQLAALPSVLERFQVAKVL